MRKVSIRDLHMHTSALVREVAEGGVTVIEHRGDAVAELRPVTTLLRMPADRKARIFASMQEIWTRMTPAGDNTAIIEDDRGH